MKSDQNGVVEDVTKLNTRRGRWIPSTMLPIKPVVLGQTPIYTQTNISFKLTRPQLHAKGFSCTKDRVTNGNA